MFQVIEGHEVYVVEFSELPQLPIYAINNPVFPAHGYEPKLQPYAEALDASIRNGIVKNPGKYAIEINASKNTWMIFAINE